MISPTPWIFYISHTFIVRLVLRKGGFELIINCLWCRILKFADHTYKKQFKQNGKVIKEQETNFIWIRIHPFLTVCSLLLHQVCFLLSTDKPHQIWTRRHILFYFAKNKFLSCYRCLFTIKLYWLLVSCVSMLVSHFLLSHKFYYVLTKKMIELWWKVEGVFSLFKCHYIDTLDTLI